MCAHCSGVSKEKMSYSIVLYSPPSEVNYPVIVYTPLPKVNFPFKKKGNVIVTAINWNILRMTSLSGGWSTLPRPERDCHAERTRHREKRRKYLQRVEIDINNMRSGRKVSVLLSKYDLEIIKERDDIYVLSSEKCERSKIPRWNVEIRKK